MLRRPMEMRERMKGRKKTATQYAKLAGITFVRELIFALQDIDIITERQDAGKPEPVPYGFPIHPLRNVLTDEQTGSACQCS